MFNKPVLSFLWNGDRMILQAKMSDYCIMRIAYRFGPKRFTVVILYNKALPLVDVTIFSVRLFIYSFFLSSVEMV